MNVASHQQVRHFPVFNTDTAIRSQAILCTTYMDAVGILGIQGCAFICILDWERDEEDAC